MGTGAREVARVRRAPDAGGAALWRERARSAFIGGSAPASRRERGSPTHDATDPMAMCRSADSRGKCARQSLGEEEDIEDGNLS